MASAADAVAASNASGLDSGFSRYALPDVRQVRIASDYCCLQEKSTGGCPQGFTKRVGHGIRAPETRMQRYGQHRTRQA